MKSYKWVQIRPDASPRTKPERARRPSVAPAYLRGRIGMPARFPVLSAAFGLIHKVYGELSDQTPLQERYP